MERLRRNIPVAFDQGGIGVILAKQAVGDACYPNIALIRLPCLDNLGACDHSAARDFRTVSDAAIITDTAVDRVYPFTVITRQYNDFIASHGYPRRLVDRLERSFFSAVAAAFYTGRNIINQNNSSFKVLSKSFSNVPKSHFLFGRL